MTTKPKQTIYKYRVSLPGLKGFARVYEVDSKTSLYAFHRRMMGDMDFPQDQIVLFKAVDENGNAISRYATVDLGKGAIDQVTVAACHAAGEDSFVYFYDTTNKKSVLLNFVEEHKPEAGVIYPALIETKGPNPIEFENGYVAFEDLPDDKKKKFETGEDDWDDEDDDEEGEAPDEDGEEVYDENED